MPSDTKRPGILVNAVRTSAFQTIGIAAGVLLGIEIARGLGPAGRGVYAFVTVSLGLLLTYGEGLSNAVIALYKTDGLPTALVYRAMLRLCLLVSLVMGGIMGLCAAFVPGQAVLWYVVFSLPFSAYVLGATGFLIADGEVWAANFFTTLNSVVLMAMVTLGLLLDRISIDLLLSAWAFCAVGTAIGVAWWTRSYARGEIEREAIGPTTRSLGVFALKSSGVYLVGYLNMRIDVFIVSAMSGPTALGWYSLAISAGELLRKLSGPLSWATFGRLAGDDLESAAKLAAKLTRIILFTQGLLALVLFFAAPWLIAFVYGPHFAPSVPVVRVLLPGLVAYAAEAAFGFFIMVRMKRPLLNFGIQSASAAACGVLSWLLLPRYGLVGAAFATSFTYVTVTIVSAGIFLSATGLAPRRLILPCREDFQALKNLVSRRAL